MRILRVFNNNVILAVGDDGQETVLTGRGLGYQARAGDGVRTDRVARRFVPATGRDPDNFGKLLAAIAPEHVELAADAVDSLGTVPASFGSSTVVALADHLSFAIKRVRHGIAMDYPLRAEISHLYPQETAWAQRLVAFVNERVSPPIPDDEVAPIALHLVNAGFNTGDLSATYRMTGVFGQIFDIIDVAYGHPLDRDSVSAARFITHLRYFFVRAQGHAQLNEATPGIAQAIRSAYPDAFHCAMRVHDLLELRLGEPITDNETVYLAMHIARLASEEPVSGSAGQDQ